MANNLQVIVCDCVENKMGSKRLIQLMYFFLSMLLFSSNLNDLFWTEYLKDVGSECLQNTFPHKYILLLLLREFMENSLFVLCVLTVPFHYNKPWHTQGNFSVWLKHMSATEITPTTTKYWLSPRYISLRGTIKYICIVTYHVSYCIVSCIVLYRIS